MERDRRSAIDCSRYDLVASTRLFEEDYRMKTIAVLFAVASLALASTSADAKGCLKGAAVGGVAGHYAGHHGVLGAVAGCIYGRRHAKQQELQRQQQQQQGKGADVGQTGM
jgi:outer membrane lipoprotein SlyB